MTTVYTISAIGRAEIANLINTYHKRPSHQRISAWVDEAEANMMDNGPDFATIEIPAFDAISGHVEYLTITGDGICQIESED